MHSVALTGPADFSGWRTAARELIRANVRPDDVEWLEDGASGSLFGEQAATSEHAEADAAFTVPRSFVELAGVVVLHQDPGKFPLLYRLLWRLRREPYLLRDPLDADVARALAMRKSVERDIHKMHAFVRFREVPGGLRIAWFEPQHHILEATAPFFVRRFANFAWSILTPEQSAHWDMHELSFGPGARRSDAPAQDAHEDLWRTYYASIFNPARLKPDAMRQHMPKKYWRNLPESSLIPRLIADAGSRTVAMLDNEPTPPRTARASVKPEVPEPVQDESLAAVRAQAQRCRDCPLWQNATQVVFGEGPQTARIVFVGEQPGDQEDIAGKPFVGPAGKLFDSALTEAGIDRKLTYVTNAVKHFKYEPRGKRRIHKKPSELEIAACGQWLRRELQLIEPKIVVALGATAARSLFGRAVAIGENRGTILAARAPGAPDVLVTVHPSYLLRVPPEQRDDEYAKFVADLRLLQPFIATPAHASAGDRR
jgi:probable DNA metabolism protein